MGGPRKQAVPAKAAGLHGCGERESAARFAFGRINLIEECILGFEKRVFGPSNASFFPTKGTEVG